MGENYKNNNNIKIITMMMIVLIIPRVEVLDLLYKTI